MIGGLLAAWWDPRGARAYVGRHRAENRTRYVGLVRVRRQRSGPGHAADRRETADAPPAAD
ncbi:MAG TPA: hypothetical protein VKY81_10065 [Natronosporangium sp.]|nr:hypothetical protein [Natronosporangium sp.]